MPAPSKLHPLSDNPTVARIQRYINLRWKGNLTVAARELRVDYDKLWRTTRRDCGRPSIDVIFAVARAMNVSAQDLVLGKLKGARR